MYMPTCPLSSLLRLSPLVSPVPTSSPERAAISPFSPERAPVSPSSPERDSVPELRPERASVPESSPEGLLFPSPARRGLLFPRVAQRGPLFPSLPQRGLLFLSLAQGRLLLLIAGSKITNQPPAPASSTLCHLAAPLLTICLGQKPLVCQSLSSAWLENPLPLPPASESRTQRLHHGS